MVYGIPNCDSTKKAMAWLKNNNIAFTFHDYKKTGISKQKLEAWCNNKGWETILNKRSTTWRALSAQAQKQVINQSAAINQMLANNSLIKRPVIEIDLQDSSSVLPAANKNLIVGFDETKITKQIK